MTVNALGVFQGPYYPNGITTHFPFDEFEVVDEGEVSATLNGAAVDASSFTVNLNDDGTGEAIFFTPPAGDGATDELYLILNPDFRQQTTLANQGPYFQTTLEKIVDRLAIRAIWLRDRILRTISVPLGETINTLPPAAERANKFFYFGPFGQILLTGGTGVDGAFRAEVGAGDGSLVGVYPAGTLREAIRILTPSMFGVPDSGILVDPEADVSAQMQALATASRNLKWPVYLAARKYVYDAPLEFGGDVIGSGVDETLLSCTASDPGEHVMLVTSSGVTVRDFTLDGNVSADPVAWNAGNYDSFVGARGMKVTASRVKVLNVVAQNVDWAGFLANPGADDVLFENCLAKRCRGNFGDGFIAMGVRRVSYDRCRAEDFTRIGFVTDSYGEPGQHCFLVSYRDCWAENGHDASIYYGGGEYNSGWWEENSGSVAHVNCHAVNCGHRGFTGTGGSAVQGMTTSLYSYENCTVTNTADGFVIFGLASQRTNAVLKNCLADVTGQTAFNVSAFAGDYAFMKNCRSILRGTSIIRRSVAIGLGEVIIDGFIEEWPVLNATYREAADNYYGSISHFNNAPGKVVIRNWKTYDDTGTHVGMVPKFLSGAANSLSFSVEKSRVNSVITFGNIIEFKDCVLEKTGVIVGFTSTLIRGGQLLAGGAGFTLQARTTTKSIRVEGVDCTFSAAGNYLYFYNGNRTSAQPVFFIHQCTFEKNVETNGYMVRVNGDGAVINTANANHVVATDNVFANTGGATATAIFQLDSPSDAASKVHGRGNIKTSTLSNTVNGAKLATAASFENMG